MGQRMVYAGGKMSVRRSVVRTPDSRKRAASSTPLTHLYSLFVEGETVATAVLCHVNVARIVSGVGPAAAFGRNDEVSKKEDNV